MTSTLHRDDNDVAPPQPGTGSHWAVVGVLAGVAGIVGVAASGFAGAVYEEEIAGDAVAITARVAELTAPILVFHTATMISALLMVVFAAGLRRDLASRLPTDSLLPSVAAQGLMLVAVAQLIGSGLTTEFVFGAADPGLMVPEVAVFFSHWMSTIPWLWVGAGVAAVAVAGAALTYGAYARWIGWTSAVLGGLTVLFGISPLQYMAGMTGPLWLTVAATGLFLGSRRVRR